MSEPRLAPPGPEADRRSFERSVRPATMRDIDNLRAGMARAMELFTTDAVAAVNQLAARIVQLEQRPAVAWRGIWREGTAYQEASLVTHAGALWIAERSTDVRPGTTDSNWRMIVKSGGAPR